MVHDNNPTGGGDGIDGNKGGGDLCIPPPEHGRTVHCNQAHYGSVSGGGAGTGYVASNYIFSIIRRCYGPRQDILDYWGTIIYY